MSVAHEHDFNTPSKQHELAFWQLQLARNTFAVVPPVAREEEGIQLPLILAWPFSLPTNPQLQKSELSVGKHSKKVAVESDVAILSLNGSLRCC